MFLLGAQRARPFLAYVLFYTGAEFQARVLGEGTSKTGRRRPQNRLRGLSGQACRCTGPTRFLPIFEAYFRSAGPSVEFPRGYGTLPRQRFPPAETSPTADGFSLPENRG